MMLLIDSHITVFAVMYVVTVLAALAAFICR